MNDTTRTHWRRARLAVAAATCLTLAVSAAPVTAQQSVARQWNEMLLESIRNDNARPTVHARNLYHVSLTMWDAWATYDYTGTPILLNEDHTSTEPEAEEMKNEAISYACYRVLRARFGASPGAGEMFPQYDQLMADLGYDINVRTTVGNTPAAVGNRIAVTVLAFGLGDGANEANNYANLFYEPVNEPLLPALPGNPDMTNPDRWQPLALDFFIDQSGNPVIGGYPDALSPEWGIVTPFSLTQDDLSILHRDGYDWWVYHDPGAPPAFPTPDYKATFEMVATWSSHLDPADGVMIDISPATIGNAPLPAPNEIGQFYDVEEGGDWGEGWDLNPVTGQPYAPNIVARGDYTRILAEFWADGPASETPPGHWFTILNYVSDNVDEKRLGGTGSILSDLEWDVKAYLALGGAMHDTAISAWGIKGYYDWLRPISALRYMADLGQSSDPLQPSYHPDGIPLRPDFIEVVTAADTMPGGKMDHLAGEEGKIAMRGWRGPDFVNDPETDVAGVDWILVENWWPYQRPSFVTPPFPGYISGHSTYSRTAANICTLLTGSPYFPDGLGEFFCPQNEFLVFEDGPSTDVTLQWAAYNDASDQTSLSRIWGGIHPPADDIPGREIGELIGPEAFGKAEEYFGLPAIWEDLGNGLGGILGVPTLEGFGAFASGETVLIKLTGAWLNNQAYLVLGLNQINAPTKGGVLVPSPDVIIPLATNPDGEITFEWSLPPGLVTDAVLYFQYWVVDPGGPAGLSASNGLSATVP